MKPKITVMIPVFNTEPYLRFICEATKDEVLQEKIAKVQEIIEKQFGGVRA